MPTGPPAMKLTALADVSGADGKQKMSIAKFLTVSVPPRLWDEVGTYGLHGVLLHRSSVFGS